MWDAQARWQLRVDEVGVGRMTAPKVAAVVVAWNRADILGDTLDALGAQTRPLDSVIVVDNASTDATPGLLQRHPAVSRVVTMQSNLGGAGGFAAGIAAATQWGADLVWIMDDDTVPREDALDELLVARAAYPGTLATLACRADWTDGREHPMNRPRSRPWISPVLRRHAEQAGARSVRTSSFVALLIDVRAVREEGLPMADFFLWNDDFEYTGRLLRRRVGLYVPRARVEHRTKTFGNSTADPGPRLVNEVRNKVWTFTRTRSFAAPDLLLYSASTLLRWGKLLVRSDDRPQVLARIRRGVLEGLRAPRPTWEVLSATPVADEVLAVERGAGRV